MADRPTRHQGSRRRQELLYDPAIATPSHAERARTLVTSIPRGTLCTHATQPEGYPYGSLVLFALSEGAPVFLISRLATHTVNLEASPKCSLLVAEAGEANPLALGRVTLVGDCAKLDEPGAARETFLARNPDASFYADFGDFDFWRLQLGAVRYIGGFGRMSWVSTEAWHAAEPDPLAPHAAGILEHMNTDHADALALYCHAFSRSGPVAAATMTGVDRYGFELSAETAGGPRPIRVAFDAPADTPTAVRTALVALVARARAQLG